MNLRDLFKNCPASCGSLTLPPGLPETGVEAITCDSRAVEPGSLFFAVKGYSADGHDYIEQALEKGAVAVVAQSLPKELSDRAKARVIRVEDSRKALSEAAAAFYNFPSREVTLVGVTGTNGKTTITWILERIFQECGFNTGVIGTINIRYSGVTLDNPVTTPDPVSLQKAMREMADNGVTHVVMEVSSHSLDQYRVEGCEFDACIYTNLTQDHLDYHEDLEDYFNCKKRLFTDFLGQPHNPGAPAVINVDDPYGKRLAQELSCPTLLVSCKEAFDLGAADVKDEITGLNFSLCTKEETLGVNSGLIGSFNLENILCAAGAALGLGIELSDIVRGIESLDRVPGRLEKLAVPLNRHIFVDYAHTPDALASILKALSKRCPRRLITVFGCGGDRDTTKRSPMGIMACQYSDIAIVTSDNPRTEDPKRIVDDIVQGIEKEGFRRLDPAALKPGDKGYILEIDREKALNLAVQISQTQDTIVAAGKGHETYQITNSGTIHFDDAEKLAQACERVLTPMDWSVQDLETALDTRALILPGEKELRFSTIGTDSRTIRTDMVFLALKGESFDGHSFIPDLIETGIRAFVVNQGSFESLNPELKKRITTQKILWFETGDTLTALGCLANFQRRRSQVKLVAITGSNGKTTTRKITHEIFSTRFDTLATQGNFNNEIGLPLTLLRLARIHEWAVIEMGMNHPGEISRLTAIAQPDMAIITNTSGAHLEGLKTAENVAHAKSEIFEGLKEGSTAIIFDDDPRKGIMEGHARKNSAISQILSFGSSGTADYQAKDIETHDLGLRFNVKTKTGTASYGINSPAPFMVNNAMAAIAAARAAGIPDPDITTGLAQFSPVKGRMNLGVLKTGPEHKIRLIDDTYNANPASMGQALKTLTRLAGKGKGLAALGDMLELGPDSDRLHHEMGVLAAELEPARLFLFGTQVAHLMKGAVETGYPKAQIFIGSKEEIANALASYLANQPEVSWLLLKGSRGMAMETLIPELESRLNPQTKGEAV